MDDFINLEAVKDDVDDVIMKFDECEPVQTVSDNEFIDDETQTDENAEDYHAFANVSRSAEDVMQDSFRELNSCESHHHEVIIIVMIIMIQILNKSVSLGFC